MSKKLALLLFGSALLFSCQEKGESDLFAGSSRMQLGINFEGSSLSGGLTNVTALLYDGEDLSRRISDMQLDEDGFYVVDTDKVKANRLIFLAGDHALGQSDQVYSYSSLLLEKTQEVDFKSTFPELFYTGQRGLTSLENVSLELALRRSVARLDLKRLTDLEVVIDSCVLTNLASQSYLLPGNLTPIPEMSYKTYSVSGGVLSNFDSLIEGVAYMYESNLDSPELSIYARINGIKNVLNVKLPSTIERNKRYEIGINSRGVTLFTQLEVLPWGEGGSVEAKPESFEARVDIENSQLVGGVTVSSSRDTVFVPASFSGSFLLSIDAPIQTEVKLAGQELGIVSLTPQMDGYLDNQFRVDVRMNDLDNLEACAKLLVKSKSETQFYDRHIVIVRESYRTHFSGLKASVDENRLVYEGYADGDLFSMSSMFPIVSITTESADDQFNWVRVLHQQQGGFLVEGAFKPNDVHALGQPQSSVMSVNYMDGFVEQFVVVRKRHSLPVVKVGNHHWVKYNMRGDSKRFEDQIGFDQDVESLWDFMKSCSDEEYAYYVGAGYKGTSTQGLYLSNHDGALLYRDYSSIANGHINSGPADSHCPAGYQIPTKSEFNEIVATQVKLNLPQNGANNHYNTERGSRYRLERYHRDSVVVDGLAIMNSAHIMITDINNGESMVFTGFGHQETQSKFTAGHWVLGLVETDGILYYGVVNSSNAMAMQSQNDQKTRIIRCVKSPTNFIIE
ncbi:MAG: hypothetical protein ACRCZM_12050 [Bacteroidales bacterium]